MADCPKHGVKPSNRLRAVLPCLLLAGFLSAVVPLEAQSIGLPQSQTDICVVAGLNHLPIRIPITYSVGADLSQIAVTTDSNWITPSIDAAQAQLVLHFATATLLNASYTATISLSGIGPTQTLYVRALISVTNIISLVDDPFRSRVYGIHQNQLGLGALVIFDPLQASYLGCITVGNKPCDLAIRPDGGEMLVICSAGRTIAAIDLAGNYVKEIIPLTDYSDWGVNETSANVEYGPGNIIYYSDGSWAPVLRVFDRSTRTTLQSIMLDGSAPNNNGGFGFGDFVTSPDRESIYAWGQYGWSAGLASSAVARFTINANGNLALQETGNFSYPLFARDPLNTPALISADGASVFIKQLRFAAPTVSTAQQTLPTPVYAITPQGEIAATTTAIYEVATGNKLYTLPVATAIQAFTSDYARLVYYDPGQRTLKSLNLLETLGSALIGRDLAPIHDSVVLSPPQLRWTPQPGIDRYRVYLGTSSSAVATATTASPEYLAEVNSSACNLTGTLQPGVTYYWRVDAVTESEVSIGTVFRFLVATIASSQSVLESATVAGHANKELEINLTSAVPGKNWSATSPASWVHFANPTGETPGMLRVIFDASSLPAGLHQSTVTITSDDGAFTLPVRLQVDPLALTIIHAVPNSAKVYAISEQGAADNTGISRAYLLEIDTLFKRINRVIRVGTGVTDIAVHDADGRIYVTNWRVGALLAVDRETFTLARTFSVPPYDSYGERDVYRIAAGRPGRLVIEEMDQWINIYLFNTSTGQFLGSSGQREGGGRFDAAKRYYYHGDNNSSGSVLHKLDTAGDLFLEVGTAAARSTYTYYGSRVVVVADDGQRIFWAGTVFKPSLEVEWVINEQINCVSADGRYAFGQSMIYDVVNRQAIGSMPVSTNVSAFSSASGQLVYQQGTVLGFYSLPGAVLPGRSRTPGNGSIVTPPAALSWSGFGDATAYRIYLGLDVAAVQSAGPDSALFLGETTANSINLPAALAAGTRYYWRVDIVVGNEVAQGEVQTFSVSNLVPSVVAIAAATVQGFADYKVKIDVTSVISGRPWAAASDAAWIRFQESTGTTPAVLTVILDSTALSVGLHEASITISNAQDTCVIPVQLQVDPLALTVIKSDRDSAMVYAISEDVAQSLPRAYLLTIDSQSERIIQTSPAGTSATDLAIHYAENRIYVPNWKEGKLLAFDRTTLGLDRSFMFRAFSTGGSGYADVYRVAAGGLGRVIVEEMDQWIEIAIYDTINGSILGTGSVREGGGQFEPSGRYYFHGENNSSGAELRKFDTAGDTLNQVSHNRGSVTNYGSRTVVVADSGNRIFWSGAVFDSSLGEIWNLADVIYSTTPDGRFAFAQNKIYDVDQRRQVFAMPVATKVSAFNPASRKLVVQRGGSLAFFAFDQNAGGAMPAPVLSVVAVSTNTVALGWTDNSLELDFTLQRRMAGTPDWQDISSVIAANATSYVVTGLSDGVAYEFRIKGNAMGGSSDWSNIAAATTDLAPPPVPVLVSASFLGNSTIRLQWTVNGALDSVSVERRVGSSLEWLSLSVLPGGTTTYDDVSLLPVTNYSYRVQTRYRGVPSGYSNSLSLTTPSPPVPPVILTQPANSVVTAGNSVSFYVVASGTGPLTYQWRLGGVNLPGGNAASYSIFNATAAAEGNYDVLVTNAAGYANSRAARLTVFLMEQYISFGAIANRPFSVSAIPLNATSSSGLPVTVTVSSGPARITGGNLYLNGAGNVVLRATQSGNQYYYPAETGQSFTAAMNYEAWRWMSFAGDEITDERISGPAADPDADGFANLVEYCLGLDPMTGTASGVLVLGNDNSDWIFTYNLRVGLTDVNCEVEVSTDLVNWGAPVAAPELVATVDGIETWRARQPLSSTNVFFRLKVTQP